MRVLVRRGLATLPAVGGLLLAFALGAASASAAAPGPGLNVIAVAGPTIFSPEHDGLRNRLPLTRTRSCDEHR